SSGWSAAQLEPVTFTESDRVALSEEDLRLRGLATAMSGATTDLSNAERVASETALSAEQECQALGASVDAVRQAGRSLVDASAHVAATTRWRTAESAALGSRNDELEAEVALRTAESVDAEARATWDARATGMSAEEFIHKGGARTATEAPPSPRPFVAVGRVALVAVVAGAMQQGPLAAVAAAAGLALWLMPASRHAPVAPSSEPVTDNGAMTAALAANSAREKLGLARTALATATANHESRVVLAETEQAAVAELSTSWGLPVASSPDDADRIRSSWSAAATKVADADQRRVQLSAASDTYAAAASAFEEQQLHLQARLESLGLASLMQPSTCADLAPKVREVVALRDKRATAEALVEEARASWLARVTPVLAEAAGRSGDWILDEADRYVRVLSQRGALLGRQTAAESTAAAIVAGDPDVTALLDEGLSSVDLDVRQRSVTEQLAEIESEMSTLDQQRGEKAAIQQTLATAEDVARLRDLRGALKDEQAEIASRAAAVFAARTLLDATVQKYERDHQPALVNRASEIACSVAADWGRVFIQPDESRIPAVEYRDLTRGVCDASRLSTGGRALLYLAFRLALVEEDALKRGARLPVLCDDPLVHLDDDRAREVIPVFRSVAERGHQVLLFTCHGRTAEVAAEAGAAVVQL
ncbi:MAG: ATP-binding protein, partial [Ilumatobacteraceae bacterium]